MLINDLQGFIYANVTGNDTTVKEQGARYKAQGWAQYEKGLFVEQLLYFKKHLGELNEQGTRYKEQEWILYEPGLLITAFL